MRCVRSSKDLPPVVRATTRVLISLLAPENNVGKIRVSIEEGELVLVPGQSAETTAHGIVIVAEKSGDACHVTVT